MLITAVRLGHSLEFASARRTVLQSTTFPIANVWFGGRPSQLDPAGTRSFHCSAVHAKNRGRTFRPRRAVPKTYRPIKPGPKRVIDTKPGNDHRFVELKGDDTMKTPLGPLAHDLIDSIRKERERKLLGQIPYDDSVEEELRMMDYYLAEDGSLEDKVFERRALNRDIDTEEERQEFVDKMEEFVKDSNVRDLGADHYFTKKYDAVLEAKYAKDMGKLPFEDPRKAKSHEAKEEHDFDTHIDPNQLAFGDWSEMLITVERTSKLWRGGRLYSYRALLIGGNLNGCGGFGLGKAKEPVEAVAKASRICKRNIFFMEPHQGDGLTRDLVGIQNNCKVVIRQTKNGLRGNPLVSEILKRYGIVNAQSKAYGRRTPLNVVQATFKALLTHESLEDIALKRGRRLVSLDRAMRLNTFD